jgi:hypothetical protein
VQAINAKNKTVCFEIVGYLLEELRDPDNFASFKEDLASANVFIGSLIFIEELAEKVGPQSKEGGGQSGWQWERLCTCWSAGVECVMLACTHAAAFVPASVCVRRRLAGV